MSDELKVLIEGLRDDIKLVAEGVSTINGKLDRHAEENKKEFNDLRSEIMSVRVDVAEIKKDLNEHRNNTELHAQRKSFLTSPVKSFFHSYH